MIKTVAGLVRRTIGDDTYKRAIRSARYARQRRDGRFARYGLDRALERVLPHRDGFYVELGANDGARASNSYYFELKKGWRGVLIEPSPNLFLECLRRRGARNAVYCNACVPHGFEDRFVGMVYADAMTHTHDLDTDIADPEAFLLEGKRYLLPSERPFEFGARAATLTSLLDDAGAPSVIDFLSLDVEGAELDVLRGVDFDAYRFRYIVVECRDFDRLMGYVAPQGYALHEKLTHHDYLLRLDAAP